MQNIVTWGQNMSANIEEFVCISMGGLFSGVPPKAGVLNRQPAVQIQPTKHSCQSPETQRHVF